MKKVFTLLLIIPLFLSCKPDESDDKDLGNVQLNNEERIAALDECRDMFAKLEENNASDPEIKLVEFLKSRPYIAGAGIAKEEKNVWANFKDGRFILFVNNLQRVPEGQQGGRTSTPESLNFYNSGDRVNKKTHPPSNARTEELPSAKKVTILNGMGTAYIDPTNAIRQIFNSSKTDYQLESAKASIDNLKKIGKDHAIFFLNTHGGADSLKVINGQVRPAVLGFWTTDSCSAANELAYQEDLNTYRLGYMVALNDQISPGKITKETHYAFTAEFVKKYMEFGENALIYFTACNGFRDSPSGLEFRQTIIDKAVNDHAAYIGWTKPIYESDGYITTKFVFDRLLGANSSNGGTAFPIPTEDPKQRPFDIDAVMKDMETRGLNISDVTDEGKVERSIMKCYSTIAEDNRFLLAPSISYVAVHELESKLHIYGIFGSDPGADGTVTVDGVPLSQIEWKKNEIVGTIPVSGKGAAGDVIVKVRNHPSNVVQLTEWQWKIEFSRSYAGTLKETTSMVLHLRADVHSFRKKPHDVPSPYVLPFLPLPGMDSVQGIRPANDSKGLYTSGGSGTSKWTGGGCSYSDKEDWAGISANLPIVAAPITEMQNHMAPACFLDPKTKTMEFSYVFFAKGRNWNYQMNQVCQDGSAPPYKDKGEMYGQAKITSPYFSKLEGLTEDEFFRWRIEKIVFDNNWNIKPYQKNFSVDEADFGFITLNDKRCTIAIKWEQAPAKFPPRNDSGSRMVYE